MTASWRKSSYSNGSQGCVEVASRDSVCLVRDSKNPGLEYLALTRRQFAGLASGLKKQG